MPLANLWLNLAAFGHARVIRVGSLLAVLVCLQQGGLGIRSTVSFQHAIQFRGIMPAIRAVFETPIAAKYRVPFQGASSSQP